MRIIRNRIRNLRNEKGMQSIPQFVWIASPILSNMITYDPKVEQSERSVMLLVVLFSFVFRPPFLLFSNSVFVVHQPSFAQIRSFHVPFLFFLTLFISIYCYCALKVCSNCAIKFNYLKFNQLVVFFFEFSRPKLSHCYYSALKSV